MMDDDVIIRRATVGEIIELRHVILRAGMDFDAAKFGGDDATDTLHFGAFEGGANVGCVSLMRAEMPGDAVSEAAYQLRGMACRADRQGCGIGARLLRFAERDVIEHTDVRVMWCNARTPAVGFYQRHGWVVISEEFDIPTAGPHRRMRRDLAKS